MKRVKSRERLKYAKQIRLSYAATKHLWRYFNVKKTYKNQEEGC
jgi:hypothetical protein